MNAIGTTKKAIVDLNYIAIIKNDNSTLREKTSAENIIYNKYSESLFHNFYSLVKEKNVLEDLVSETMIKAMTKIENFDSTKGAFSTWIYRIARNSILDFNKKHKNENVVHATNLIRISELRNELEVEFFVDYEQLDNNSNVENIYIKKEERKTLNEKIKGLKENKRINQGYVDVLIMRFINELSYEEIAKKLDLPIGTVKTKIIRGKELIRKEYN